MKYGTKRAESGPAGPVIVITGATAGVGRATARAFARQGASIGLIARGRDGLDGARRDVETEGGRGLALQADVADADAIEAAADEIERTYGPIDVWVNNAMTSVFAPLHEMSPAEFRRVTEVTYLGTVYGTMAALRRMRPRDRGAIVQVGSALAYRSIPLQAAYCGAKHAIVGFTDSLRSELIHDGSQVSLVAVHLPGMNTPQFDWGRNKMPKRPQPMPPVYQPEVAAEAIHYAVRNPRRELWLGWVSVETILGQRLTPSWLDSILARKAYDGQQTDEPAPDGDDNLFSTVDGNFGAHGRFDSGARSTSSELWLIKNRSLLGVLGIGSVAALIAGLIASK